MTKLQKPDKFFIGHSCLSDDGLQGSCRDFWMVGDDDDTCFIQSYLFHFNMASFLRNYLKPLAAECLDNFTS